VSVEMNTKSENNQPQFYQTVP